MYSSSTIKPFLLTQTEKVIDLSEIGGSIDFKKRMVELFGPEVLTKESSKNVVLLFSRIHDQETDLIGLELAKQGINYIRIDAEDFPNSCFVTFYYEEGIPFFKFKTPYSEIDSREISVIWFKNLKFEAFSLEPLSLVEYKYLQTEWNTFIAALTDYTNARWINHPYLVNRLNKIKQLVNAQQIGMNVPKTIVSNNPLEIKKFSEKNNNQTILKAFFHYIEAYGKLYGVFGHKIQLEELNRAEELQRSPVIVQNFISYSREIRVTVLNGKVFATEMENTTNSDWHHLNILDIKIKNHELPESLIQNCLTYLEINQLQYGAFDFLLTKEGEYFFLEVNPQGDWRWIENANDNWKETKPITREMVQLILDLMESDLK